ncbi:MAG TPA: hypothetical protein VM802_13275 [Chitinophaga sp.]|uniref:LIC_13387 family protein n=1 Tax=Chitinophaga sp. TaxID=1869181 RepID=UPI002CFB8E6D|nr:hypothetical protein [Chitinophaga sp.]HVI45839.1 hypothetical protein [Chitinophaga sp.]
MPAKYLWETGAVIISLMGLLHLRATLFTNKLYPRKEQLIKDMEETPLVMTEQLTMWKSWIGFNATHSSGALFIGIVNYYLALKHFDFLNNSHFLLLFTIATVTFYVWVAARFWFKVVLGLLTIACLCFITSYILLQIN